MSHGSRRSGGGGGSNIQQMLNAYLFKKLLESPEEKEYSELKLESLKKGQSPSQAYKTNIDIKAGDYKTSIDLDTLGVRKKEIEAYKEDRLMKDKNILPTTIDYIDNIIEDIDKRTTTVTSFNTSIDELANIENNLNDVVKVYMNPKAAPEDKSSAIDKIKAVNESRMRISNQLKSLDTNRYLKDNSLKFLDSDMRIKGAYVIDAIHSDNLMDNYEHKIWQNAIDSDNPEIIRQYYLERSTFKTESAKDMIEGFGTFGSQSIEAYNDMIRIGKESGEGSNAYKAARTEYNNQRNTLYTLKTQMEESMGIGKVNVAWNTIFPDGVPWQPIQKKRVESKDIKKSSVKPFVKGEQSVEDYFNENINITDDYKSLNKTGLPKIAQHSSGTKRKFLYVNQETGKWEEWKGDTVSMRGINVPVMIDSNGKKRFYDYVKKQWK